MQPTAAQALLSSPAYQDAKSKLLGVLTQASQELTGIRPGPADGSPERDAYRKLVEEFVRDRGRDLFFPFVSSGMGNGPYVELMDGSVKLDLISGIGVNFFGHSHPAYMSEMADALTSDVLQGNLQPGIESREVLRAVLGAVAKSSPQSRLKHGWLMCSGTMVNEVALKIIRQKKSPATRIFAFKDCFAGRSTAMQEITDNPGYRQGQPVYGEVSYLSFYDPKLGLDASVARTLDELREQVTRYPGRYAALMIEPIQGEGGFQYGPREWYVRVFEEARKHGIAIWADEIQTFGRTGELFAFQKLRLEEYIDVVTAAKMLQASMVLYTEEYNPKPGLVAGTFSGTAVALRTARKTIEMLVEGGYLGPGGKIEKLSAHFTRGLEALKAGSCAGKISEVRAIGGMIGFVPHSGSLDDVKRVLFKLYDLGVVAFYCGHGPYLVRMLPPLGVMTEKQIDEALGLIGEAVRATDGGVSK